MSSDLNPEFVERCQILLSQDPKSRIFAPLAEAYRKMSLFDEAEAVAKRRIKSSRFPQRLSCLCKNFVRQKEVRFSGSAT